MLQGRGDSDAASRLLIKYGPLFDDVIGNNDAQAQKHASIACLLSLFLHFACRTLSAVLFGVFDLEYSSPIQIRLLLALHTFYLSYLALIRPYSNQILMLVELVCNFCEWGILLMALILSENNQTFDGASQILLTFAYIDIGSLTLYEFIRMGKYIWQACHARTKTRFSVMDSVLVKRE